MNTLSKRNLLTVLMSAALGVLAASAYGLQPREEYNPPKPGQSTKPSQPSARLLPDLHLRNVQTNEFCQIVVTVENLGPGLLPDTAWPNSQLAIGLRGAVAASVPLATVDPGHRLRNPGGSATYMSLVKVPAGGASANATVDFNNAVVEANEGNNNWSGLLTCASTPARQSVTIPSALFTAVFNSFFAGAVFQADSCVQRQARLTIPTIYDRTEALPQFSYDLNYGEENALSSLTGGAFTLTKFYACVNNVATATGRWSGSIEGGRIKISVPFRDPGAELKTYAQKAVTVPPFGLAGAWVEVGGWDDNLIPDFNVDNLSVDLYLTPVRDARGRLSYGAVEVRINTSAAGLTGVGHILESMTGALNAHKDALRRRGEAEIQRALNDDRIRNQVADAIMAAIRNPPFNVRQIVSVRGNGTSIDVEYY